MIENFQRSNYFFMLAAGAMLIGFAPIFVKWSELSSSSILFYRMQSLDPGIMMPESGRALEHKEGTELIRKWIKNL